MSSFDFTLEETCCCALGIISNENFNSSTNSLMAAAQVRIDLHNQQFNKDMTYGLAPEAVYSTVIATVSTRDKNRYGFLNAVYKAAKFKSMGPPVFNPNSGHKVKKWYIHIGPKFKP